MTACGEAESEEIIDTPPAPPLSEQSDSYALGDITVQSAGGYTGYITLDDGSVEVHPYFDLTECLNLRVIYTSGQDWWKVATTDIPVTDMGEYQLVQKLDGSIYGFKPIDEEHGVFVTTSTLPLGYVQLYMDKLWISDT